MLGIRLTFNRSPLKGLIAHSSLEWFWEAAEVTGVPVMILAPEQLDQIGELAPRHPGLRLIIDHLGLTPHKVYESLDAHVGVLCALARYPNVGVKASALPCSVAEEFPFPSLRGPVSRVIAQFGADRVFWGSDLTRLPCTYGQWVRYFTEELELGPTELRLVMGKALMEWLRWGDESLGRPS